MLSVQAIHEYQDLYKKWSGKDISYEEALDQGTRLVGLVRTVFGSNVKSNIPVKLNDYELRKPTSAK